MATRELFLRRISDLIISFSLAKEHKTIVTCLIKNNENNVIDEISKLLKLDHNILLEKLNDDYIAIPYNVSISFISPYTETTNYHKGCYTIDFTNF